MWVFARSRKDSRIIQVLNKQKNRDMKLTTLESVLSWGPDGEGPGNPSMGPCRPGIMQCKSVSVSTTQWFAESARQVVKNNVDCKKRTAHNVLNLALHPDTPPLNVRLLDIVLPWIPG